MNSEAFRQRTKNLAIRIIQLIGQLPKTKAADVMGKQLLRCGTSVGANYRAACRARSNSDFISKMGIVEEEADEVIYWMELLKESGCIDDPSFKSVADETNQLVAMTVASVKTARGGSR